MTSSNLPDAQDRHRADQIEHRVMWGMVVVLVAWLVIGFFRTPAAGGIERLIVALITIVLLVVLAVSWPWRVALPALDRTPRTATVTGRTAYNTEPDSEGICDPYELISVRVDMSGTPLNAQIADIIVAESLDRFIVGSVWSVYAFAEPTVHGDGANTRVILSEQHDDVVRSGYNLSKFTLRGTTGVGSDLLQRRFANDE